MATWINHVGIAATRNATTTHTVDPTSGTVAVGSTFTPTAGNLLVCVVDGSVTSTTPTGWTLPTSGSAIDNTGLYVWYRTAAGGGDSLTTTHNAANYPIIFDFYEFASGSTFVKSASAITVSPAGGAGPTLSGLSGTNTLFAVGAQSLPGSAASATWSAGTESTDTSVAGSPTDGYEFTVAYMQDSVLTSWSSAMTTAAATNCERLVFAVNIPAAALYPFGVTAPTPRYNTATSVYG